jgi:UDP-2,4-diacetamido-2,4,6-trideoxy-beta-L-altropyranose hydrolase
MAPTLWSMVDGQVGKPVSMKKPKIFAIRVDSSVQMGTGHAMRCLTLADAILAQGGICHFITRMHSGNLAHEMRRRGFTVTELPVIADDCPALAKDEPQPLAHSHWLGCDWRHDAEQTSEALKALQPDWLVVDHYALDLRWEAELSGSYQRLLVIDDLADRPHRCDVLLDQNLGRVVQDYVGLVPDYCVVLAGPQYALLRPEFAELRLYSLERRKHPKLKQLLITMGGVDQPNATGQVLQALSGCELPSDCRITVVMGSHAPWLAQVQAQALQMPWFTEVVVNVDDMAQRMADSDLAIGAAGSTSWERCCLGLPTLMVVLAENQLAGAQALEAVQAARLIGNAADIATALPIEFVATNEVDRMIQMTAVASGIVDGLGVERVIELLGSLSG